MKANFYTESVLYWAAKRVSALAQKLPPEWNVRVGAAVGWLLYYLLPGRRIVARDNLTAAFGRNYTPAQVDGMIRDVFMNMGRTFMEVAAIPAIDREYVDRWVAIAPGSQSRLEKALAAGKGVIFLTGHFGNWEWIPITGALHGYPTLVLAREQGWPKLNKMLVEYRESKGCKVVTKGFPVRELIQGLREKRIIGILADQDGGMNGLLSPFFGRLASTAPGAISLSLRTGAPVLPVFMVRNMGAAHTLMIEPPLPIPEKGTEQDRLQAGVDAYMQVMENYVHRFPTQWLWLHRRWKTSPERRVLIFSDGKAGHAAQSRALAQRLDTVWRERAAADKRLKGIKPPALVTARTIPVAFRHPLLRYLLDIVATVQPLRWFGAQFWLWLALTPECLAQFQSEHADVSISCGASTASVNLIWAGRTRCKPVHIFKTFLPPGNFFKLNVVPRHDLRPSSKSSKKLLVTEGALVPRRAVPKEKSDEWAKLLKVSPRKRRIGLLLGGPAKKLDLDPAEVERIAADLLSTAERLDAELLVTTSRRTTPLMESRLAETLGKDPRCKLLALVNQKRPGALPDTETAVPCILELSDVLVVSGDSISMVCEAAATGKPLLAFPPKAAAKNGKKPPQLKHDRFLRRMDQLGRLRLSRPEQLGERAAEALSGRPSSEEPTPQPDPVVEFLRSWV